MKRNARTWKFKIKYYISAAVLYVALLPLLSALCVPHQSYFFWVFPFVAHKSWEIQKLEASLKYNRGLNSNPVYDCLQAINEKLKRDSLECDWLGDILFANESLREGKHCSLNSIYFNFFLNICFICSRKNEKWFRLRRLISWNILIVTFSEQVLLFLQTILFELLKSRFNYFLIKLWLCYPNGISWWRFNKFYICFLIFQYD